LTKSIDMPTRSASYFFLGLLALCAAGCDLVRDQSKRETRSSDHERSDAVPTIPSSVPVSQTPATASATTAKGPATTATNPAREDGKTTTKKEAPSTVASIDTRTLEGTVRAIDAQRRLISINVRGQSQTFPVDPTAPIENLADQAHALKGGLAAIRPGASVLLVIYRNKSDREAVSLIRVKGLTK
jgi:hypothetical protein